MHMVESGKMRPSPRFLRQIATRTGRPISYFLASTEVTAAQRAATDELAQLVAAAEFATAIEHGERLLKKKDLPREVEAEARFLVGRAHVRSLDGRKALRHLVRARELYEVTGDQVLADVLNQTACAFFLLDDPRALSAAYQALDVCERLRPPQPELTVRTLIVVAMVYKRLQDWTRAITIYERALQEMRSAPNIRDLALIHDHLSQTLQRVGRFSEAVNYARKAMRFHAGSLDPTDLFRAEHNLGETLLRQGELRAARPHLERALVLCEERGLRRQARGFALLSMAELHLACDELDRAEARLVEAMALVEELGERGHRATTYRLLGRLHAKRGEYEQAGEAFLVAVRLLKDLQLPADVLDVLAELAASLQVQGRVQEALDVSQQAIASGKLAVRRIQGGWDDVVAAHWGR